MPKIKTTPEAMKALIREAIISPTDGPCYLAATLHYKGHDLSPSTVCYYLKKFNLSTIEQRLRLQQAAIKRINKKKNS